MTNEIVFSQIENKGNDLMNAPFWKDCYHDEERTPEQKMNGKTWYKYHIKFNGVKPQQLTKIEKI